MNYKNTKMYREILEQPKVLAGLRQSLSFDLDKIASAIKKKKPKFIALASRGSSSNAGMYFKYLSEIFLGLPVQQSFPSVYTVYSGNMNLGESVCIGISQSGKAQDAIMVLENAKKSGAITIAVTNDIDSPMAKAAEFHLFLNAEKEESVAATKTMTSQMYTLLLLTEKLFGKPLGSEDIPAAIEKVLNSENQIALVAEKLKAESSAIILGRGLNYSAALECSLKMQETTYTFAKGYAASDFHHGPVAVVDKNSIIVLLADNGKTHKNLVEIKNKCEAVNAKTIVLTDGDLRGNLATISLPKGTDISYPFCHIVAFQLLVNALSIAKGLTPDAPRGLNKVTVTI